MGLHTHPVIMSAHQKPSGLFGLNYLRPGDYYAKCMLGGVLACGLTHAAVVTLDVNKCRTQAHSKSGAWPSSFGAGIKKIMTEEGAAGLGRGIVPTFFGYGAQGMFKFGLNELFKDVYTNAVGKEWVESATWKKMVLWAAASGSAEIFADIALCPFEMTKVKMQVSLTKGEVPSGMISAMKMMSANAKETKFPFGSLVPLWGRQVPYTMIKFVGFYQTQEMVYDYLKSSTGKSKDQFTQNEQLAITFGCGYWAGIFCAVATQPMDNLVSMKGNPINQHKGWGEMAAEMGTRDLFLKGLGTRIVMIGTLTGLQWFIYGNFKSAMGFGTS